MLIPSNLFLDEIWDVTLIIGRGVSKYDLLGRITGIIIRLLFSPRLFHPLLEIQVKQHQSAFKCRHFEPAIILSKVRRRAVGVAVRRTDLPE